MSSCRFLTAAQGLPWGLPTCTGTSAPLTPVNELRSLPSSTELSYCHVAALVAQLIRRRVCFQEALSEHSESVRSSPEPVLFPTEFVGADKVFFGDFSVETSVEIGAFASTMTRTRQPINYMTRPLLAGRWRVAAR